MVCSAAWIFVGAIPESWHGDALHGGVCGDWGLSTDGRLGRAIPPPGIRAAMSTGMPSSAQSARTFPAGPASSLDTERRHPPALDVPLGELAQVELVLASGFLFPLGDLWCLGQDERVRAARPAGLMDHRQLGGVDPGVDVLTDADESAALFRYTLDSLAPRPNSRQDATAAHLPAWISRR